MKFTAFVVNNIDQSNEGKIEVFIPKLHPLFKAEDSGVANNSYSVPKTSVTSNNKISATSTNLNEKNTITARPYQYNSSSSFGNLVIPRNNTPISVFFMNDDMTQCYYDGLCGPYQAGTTLNYGAALEGASSAASSNPSERVNQYVLLSTDLKSIIAIDDNAGSASIQVSLQNKNKLVINSGGGGDNIELKTHSGYSVNVDDANSKISLTTKNNQVLSLDDVGNKITLSTGGSLIEIDSAGAITLTTASALNINASGIVTNSPTMSSSHGSLSLGAGGSGTSGGVVTSQTICPFTNVGHTGASTTITASM